MTGHRVGTDVPATVAILVALLLLEMTQQGAFSGPRLITPRQTTCMQIPPCLQCCTSGVSTLSKGLQQATGPHPQHRQPRRHSWTPGIRVPGIGAQFKAALEFVKDGRHTAPTRDRLAVMYLHNHGHGTRDSALRCAVTLLQKHVGSATPLDIFVFTGEAHAQRLQQQLQLPYYVDLPDPPHVLALGIPRAQWTFVAAAYYGNSSRISYDSDYLLMGQWRLLVPFRLAAMLKYEFVLQTDDDLYLTAPFKPGNLVESMRARGALLATHLIDQDEWEFTRGLPELARFFLVSRNITPSPVLWDHVNPPTLKGLHTGAKPELPHLPSPSGYDRSHLYGNFLVMSTALWGRKQVQDWVTTCILSGGLERHRWQEQGVLAFVWLLFVARDQLWVLDMPGDLSWDHDKHPDKPRHWCKEAPAAVQ